jgi:2-iminoacetate synthase
MDLAKPGEIKKHCDPNAVSTFTEYLIDYASKQTQQAGEVCIARNLIRMSSSVRRISESMRKRVLKGKRDVFC